MQLGTPYSDGAAYVTQCPILPSQVFTYRFMAVQAGTFFYHSHFGNQRNDGTQGMIIVHQTVPPPLPYFPVMIQEWNHMDAITIDTEDPTWPDYPGPGDGFTLNPVYKAADGNPLVIDVFDAGLINGRGRYQGNQAPLTSFTVTSGQKYRFYLTNAGFNFIFKVEIDEHIVGSRCSRR
jgi:FtsP/CotA-like multicopper oxidase with cupredoxin domain